jgi:alkylated DNA repair dioxygenase AlkB
MNIEKIETIPGLYYVKNVIKNIDIIDIIDKLNNNWIPLTNNSNSRLVQHYGYKYNYKTYRIDEKTDDIPDFLNIYIKYATHICKHLNLINDDYKFNQIIINNYTRNQKISAHTDVKSYGDVIACFSLGDTGVMKFNNKDNNKLNLNVENNSLYIMSGDSRFKYTHEMLNLKGERRISITLRKV